MTTSLTARSPEDLLAVVPLVLGFVPADSVVMLTFGAATSFHARVDLPRDPDDTEAMVEALVEPAVRHDVPQVVFVAYTGDAVAGDRVKARLVRRCREAGIEVVDVLRADGARWFPLLRHRRGVPPGGVRYDVTAHPFVAQAILDGRVTHGSREELAATLRPDPDRVRRVVIDRTVRPAGRAWVAALVARHIAAGSVVDDVEAARLLVSLADPDARDAAWGRMRRETARADVEFWSDLVRRAPETLVAHASSVLAFAAWLAGHGALAWCAVDRAREADPDHSLARLVHDLLAAAVPPSNWTGLPEMRDLA